MAQVQNSPIYSLPYLYISGLNISVASTTVLAIEPGQARDSTDTIDMPVGFPNLQNLTTPATQFQGFQPPLLLNSAVNGANGLDTGTLAASTPYAIYLIGDSRGYNPVAAILSKTANVSPLLPTGYDSLRLIGMINTDGSSHFVYATFKPQNMKFALSYYNSPAISVLTAGTSTTFAAIDLTTNTAIPTTTLPNIIVTLQVTFTPLAAGDVVQFRPIGITTATGYPTIIGLEAGIAQTQYIQVFAAVSASKPQIDYLVTSASDSVNVSVVGWTGVSNTAYPALV
jgi:hypothetical protein